MSQESGNKWVMPEPIFRHSTGELVKPSKPIEFDAEPDTLAPELQNEPEVAVDPDADTLVPDAPDATGYAVDPEADTLAPDLSDKADQAVESETDPHSPDISPSKSADDPLSKLYSPPENTTDDPTPEPAQASPPQVEIEPQPYVSEQFSAEKIVLETEPRPTKGSARPIALAVGLIVLLCIAAGIIALVYYLLYMNRSDTGGF